jgi:hypothetical protein
MGAVLEIPPTGIQGLFLFLAEKSASTCQRSRWRMPASSWLELILEFRIPPE